MDKACRSQRLCRIDDRRFIRRAVITAAGAMFQIRAFDEKCVTSLPTDRESSAVPLDAAMLAHEMNNLLLPLQLEASRALRTGRGLDAALRRAVAVSKQLSSAADLLLRGREAGTDGPMAVGAVVHRAVQLAGVCTEIEVQVNLAGVVDTCVPGPLLMQVLVNILQNASQAGVIGRETIVEISGHLDRSTWNRPTLLLTIRDNGRGLSFQNEHAHGHSDRSGRPSGHGLGLAVCRRLLSSIDGHLTLANREDGQGTKVSLQIPTIVSRSGSLDGTGLVGESRAA